MRCFWSPEMSSDGNHTQAHMTLTARNICTCVVFFFFFFYLILAFQNIICRVLWKSFNKSRANWLCRCHENVTHVLFAWFPFALANLKIYFFLALPETDSFPSRILYINLTQCCFLSSMFRSWVRLILSLLTLFVI